MHLNIRHSGLIFKILSSVLCFLTVYEPKNIRDHMLEPEMPWLILKVLPPNPISFWDSLVLD